jgi:hypothetical protein
MRVLQALMMAAIVATLLCVPVGALVALLAYVFLDVPVHSILTFGGALHAVGGLLAWWTVAFVAAVVYAGFAMPEPQGEQPVEP